MERRDLPEILKLQKSAYKSEAEIYKGDQIQPMTQTLADLEKEFESWTFFKLVRDDKIIGSVRCVLRGDTCHIGKLIVAPEFQNQGIGTRLLRFIESFFSSATRYELFTGHKSERNLYLYQKHGYKIFREKKLSDFQVLVYLEKKNVVT